MGKKENQINFTKAAIGAIQPAAKRMQYRDEKVRGLYLFITPAGNKTFYAVRWVEGKAEFIKLGPFPDMPIDIARERAEEVNTRIAKGENPAADKRKLKADPTFGELFDWWLERLVTAGRSEKYLEELRRQRKSAVLAPLIKMKATLVKRADVRHLHDSVGAKTPYMANRYLATIHAIYKKAISHERVSCQNPADGIEGFDEQERERRLLPGDVEQFLEAVAAEEDQDIQDVVLLALYTGARRNQVLSMRWADVDLAARTWNARRTKGGRPQVLPLEDQEIEILTRRREAIPVDRGRVPVTPGG